jgi:hypothetical protein
MPRPTLFSARKAYVDRRDFNRKTIVLLALQDVDKSIKDPKGEIEAQIVNVKKRIRRDEFIIQCIDEEIKAKQLVETSPAQDALMQDAKKKGGAE